MSQPSHNPFSLLHGHMEHQESFIIDPASSGNKGSSVEFEVVGLTHSIRFARVTKTTRDGRRIANSRRKVPACGFSRSIPHEWQFPPGAGTYIQKIVSRPHPRKLDFSTTGRDDSHHKRLQNPVAASARRISLRLDAPAGATGCRLSNLGSPVVDKNVDISS